MSQRAGWFVVDRSGFLLSGHRLLSQARLAAKTSQWPQPWRPLVVVRATYSWPVTKKGHAR